MGRLRKPEGQRQGHRKPRHFELVKRADIPFPPTGLLKVTSERWVSVWKSAVAALWDDRADMAAIERLFRLYDERERAYRWLRKQRLTAGSKGQPRLSPLASYVDMLDKRIEALEDRLGLSPRGRLQLGTGLADLRGRLDALNAGLEVEAAEDPRLTEETGSSST